MAALAENSMRIFPFEKYKLKSRLSLKELYASIDESCRLWRFSAYFNDKREPLFGKRIENKFRVYSAFRYRNSSKPIAFGTIYDNGEEISVEVTLRPNILVILFVAVWVSSLLIISYFMPIAPSLIPIGMAALGYLVMNVCFWFDVPKLKKEISIIVVEYS